MLDIKIFSVHTAAYTYHVAVYSYFCFTLYLVTQTPYSVL